MRARQSATTEPTTAPRTADKREMTDVGRSPPTWEDEPFLGGLLRRETSQARTRVAQLIDGAAGPAQLTLVELDQLLPFRAMFGLMQRSIYRVQALTARAPSRWSRSHRRSFD